MTEKPKKLSREEIAKIEIGHTTITKGQIFFLCAIFLATIFIYPVLQFSYEYRTRNDIVEAVDFQPMKIFRYVLDAKWTGGFFNGLDYNRQLLEAIKKYEDTLEDTSALRATFLASVQKLMIESMGTGNEKVIIGSDGWLFYVSGLNYLTNPGFLLKERLYKRNLAGGQPDPVKAVLDFNRQLKERDIQLIILPATVKPMIYADKLNGQAGVLQNPSFAEFKSKLEAEGIKVMDYSNDLYELRKSGIEPFLKTDTHWTPAGMQLVAAKIAAEIGNNKPMSDKDAQAIKVTNLGDIAAMLNLDDPAELFPQETVTIRQVKNVISSESEVLLLGDSFANIYSLGAMNWGSSAGLAENIAFELGSPVEAIIRNDAGAFSTREILSLDQKRGIDRLAGKKVVIWEFAARELVEGDWKMFDISLGEAPEATFFAPEKPQVVNAKVLAVSSVPRPHSAPYKDHVVSIHLGEINGTEEQALVFAASMRDNVWTPAAQLRPGDKVEIKLSPWEDYQSDYDSWNRSDLDDLDVMLQQPCWGELTAFGAEKGSLHLFFIGIGIITAVLVIGLVIELIMKKRQKA